MKSTKIKMNSLLLKLINWLIKQQFTKWFNYIWKTINLKNKNKRKENYDKINAEINKQIDIPTEWWY